MLLYNISIIHSPLFSFKLPLTENEELLPFDFESFRLPGSVGSAEFNFLSMLGYFRILEERAARNDILLVCVPDHNRFKNNKEVVDRLTKSTHLRPTLSCL